MPVVYIPEELKATRGCPFDDENPEKGTECPEVVPGKGFGCNRCDHAHRDITHMKALAQRKKETLEEMTDLQQELEELMTIESSIVEHCTGTPHPSGDLPQVVGYFGESKVK